MRPADDSASRADSDRIVKFARTSGISGFRAATESPAAFNLDQLETYFRGDLQPSRIEYGSRLTEGGVGEVAVDSVQVHAIEEVEKLKSQLEIRSFS